MRLTYDGFVRASLPLVLVAVALAAGCGGGKAGPTTTRATPQITAGLRGLPRSASCVRKGITTRAARAGTCKSGATTVVIVNRAARLGMGAYGVELTGLRTAATLGRRAAENFEPGGRFVVVALRVQNPGKSRLLFDRSTRVAYLLLGGQLYPEIPGAEAQVSDSFHLLKAAVRPGKTHMGTVVFDPPARQAAKVRTQGYLVFLKLGEELSGPPRLGAGKTLLGFIRLWQ